jgi:hypothetical protein
MIGFKGNIFLFGFIILGCNNRQLVINSSEDDFCYIKGSVIDEASKEPIKMILSLHTEKLINEKLLTDSLVSISSTNDSGYFFVQYPKDGKFWIVFYHESYMKRRVRLGVKDVGCKHDTIFLFEKINRITH